MINKKAFRFLKSFLALSSIAVIAWIGIASSTHFRSYSSLRLKNTSHTSQSVTLNKRFLKLSLLNGCLDNNDDDNTQLLKYKINVVSHKIVFFTQIIETRIDNRNIHPPVSVNLSTGLAQAPPTV